VEGDSTFSALRSVYICVLFVHLLSVSDVAAVQLM